MVSKYRAVLNIIALSIPLILGLSYSLYYNLNIPDSIIIPTTGGGLMNLGFWFFYKNTFEPIPELRKSIFGNSQLWFLCWGLLHFVAIGILLIFDVSWIFELQLSKLF